MDFKKKLHLLNPDKKPKEIEIQKTKRNTKRFLVSQQSIERDVRELLSRKVSSIYLGLWLLIPEHLRIGSWDLLKAWSGQSDTDLNPRLAMQMVSEAALCVSGLRPVRSLCHQEFELLNGLPFVATDKSIHILLNEHTVAETEELQIALGKLRLARGHYAKSGLFAFDPHRIHTYSRRIIPVKKDNWKNKSKKIMQTFFCIDIVTGQPLGFTIGSSSTTASKAAIELLGIIKSVLSYKGIAMADCEHATAAIINEFNKDEQLDIIMPMPITKKMKEIIKGINYQRMWAGYALGETTYMMRGVEFPIKIVVQRDGEIPSQYQYKPFAVTGESNLLKLITHLTQGCHSGE